MSSFETQPLTERNDVTIRFSILWFKIDDAIVDAVADAFRTPEDGPFANAKSANVKTYAGGPSELPDGFDVTYTVIGQNELHTDHRAVALLQSTLEAHGIGCNNYVIDYVETDIDGRESTSANC